MTATDKHFQIEIRPAGWRLDGSDAMTVLEAAQFAAVTLPSSCRNGTCRTCICRLVTGTVSYRIEWPGLSADEKAEGFILACVAYPQSDLVIEASATIAVPDAAE